MIDLAAFLWIFTASSAGMLRHSRDYVDRRQFADWDRRGPVVRFAWSCVGAALAGVMLWRALA